MRMLRTIFFCAIAGHSIVLTAAAGPQPDAVPVELRKWLQPQDWDRDTDGPIISLGHSGQFDDTHVLAPCVAKQGDAYWLWYNGSRGTVAERVFNLGLATSSDGRTFTKHKSNPVFRFGDNRHSVLTTTLLRGSDGAPVRENGKLRMWFSSTDFSDGTGHHALYETQSIDGIQWDAPSSPLLDNVYAPTILREGNEYRMWYTDVSGEAWAFRMATSRDGRKWSVHPEELLKPEADWEKSRLFYPTVLKIDGIYLMWYGSYWSERPSTTAIGFAVSLDGYCWYRSPHSPVLRPDAERAWESHYTTSQSIIRNEDGSFRIWYASRKHPPFVNKYFALNTAVWAGPDADNRAATPATPATSQHSRTGTTAGEFATWKTSTQQKLSNMLGLPDDKVELQAEKRGETESDGIVIEKWVYASEKGSLIPAVLYRPNALDGQRPGVVLTFGHGGSKSHPCYQYIGQLYAKLGIICLAADPAGEEERHRAGRMGTRAHDPRNVHLQAWNADRSIMGKLVWDTMRGVDFLLSRDDIDPNRIGVAGNSLGGAKAGWMAALDDRLSFAIVSGWAFDDVNMRSKYCTRIPNQKTRELLTWSEYLMLSAPDCRMLIANGDADVIIDRNGDRSAWYGTQRAVDQANAELAKIQMSATIETWIEPGGGHRPYPAHPDVVRWLHRTVFPDRPIPELRSLSFSEWCDQHNVKLERLYGTPLHLGGATVVERKIVYRKPDQLAVLNGSERGKSRFTLQGWLTKISSTDQN